MGTVPDITLENFLKEMIALQTKDPEGEFKRICLEINRDKYLIEELWPLYTLPR